MSINYDKYINSTSTHYISNSGGDERGKITGGAAGDQTGKEWQLKAWYNRPWTHVFRHPDPQVRRLIAELAIEAALNNKIGYDQNQRGTFWTQLKASGYRPSNITTKCEADCSAGANSIVKAVGYLLDLEKLKNVSSANSSRNTRAALKAAGFEVLTEKKYLTSGKYLLPGDILLYENHHVATNVTRGKYATGEVGESLPVGGQNTTLGDRPLMFGNNGADVKELQERLIALGYSCGKDGADGDFGNNTKTAVSAFQATNGLTANGIATVETITALLSADAKPAQATPTKTLTVANCTSCNIRIGPGTSYGTAGVVKSGDTLTAVDVDGWTPVNYNGSVLWISNKYVKESE